MCTSRRLFVGNAERGGGRITLGLSGALQARELRSLGGSAPQAWPAPDQPAAQTFPDKHHGPSALM